MGNEIKDESALNWILTHNMKLSKRRSTKMALNRKTMLGKVGFKLVFNAAPGFKATCLCTLTLYTTGTWEMTVTSVHIQWNLCRDHCHERPPVLKDHQSSQCKRACQQRPPALRDHISRANGVVLHDRLHCTSVLCSIRYYLMHMCMSTLSTIYQHYSI